MEYFDTVAMVTAASTAARVSLDATKIAREVAPNKWHWHWMTMTGNSLSISFYSITYILCRTMDIQSTSVLNTSMDQQHLFYINVFS